MEIIKASTKAIKHESTVASVNIIVSSSSLTYRNITYIQFKWTDLTKEVKLQLLKED